MPDIIRYLGSRYKIFLCHFRNIVGKRNKFQEVWPDEGVMNMHRNMQALKEVGYAHMCVPDHTNLDLAPTVSFPYLLLSDDCDHILSQERQDTDHAFVDGVFSLGDTGDHGARRHGHHSI